MTSNATQFTPHTIVLLGGEGLRPDSSELWNRIFSMSKSHQKAISFVYAGVDPKDTSQRQRRLKSMFDALTDLGMETKLLDISDGGLPGSEEMVYLSGINQPSIVDNLAGTTLWKAICIPERLLIVSSGVSVAVGEQAFAPIAPYPAALDELEFSVNSGLGLIPGVMILPYFGWLPDFVIERIAELVPDLWLIGIDDQAALILHDDQWEVAGLGTVTVFKNGEPARIFDPGAVFPPPASTL